MIAYFDRPLRRSVILLLLLSTAAWAMQPQNSQDIVVNGSQLTIGQAITLALENNLELGSFRESLGIARGQVTGAKLFPTNPEIDFIYFNANPLEPGGPVRASEYSFGLSQEFEIGGQRRYRKRMAQSAIDKLEAEVGRHQWLLVGHVRETFYQVLLQQRKLELANRVSALTEELVGLTEGRFSAGFAPEFEVNFAKLELQRARREKARVLNQLEVAKYRLNNLVDRPWATEFTAVGELLHYPLEFDAEQLKAYAVINRRDLEALQSELEMAESEVKLARSQRIPNLRFSFLLDREIDKNASGVMISLPIKLFNRNQGNIAASTASLKTLELRYSFLKFLIEMEVASAYSDALRASKEVQLLEQDMLDLAKKNMDLVQQAYLRGEVEIIDVITAQRNFVETQTAYLEGLYDFNAAAASLEEFLGGNLSDISR